MELAVRGHNLALSQPIEDLVRRRLDFALGRFGSRIRRVDVKLADINGPRGGVDKQCSVDVTLSHGGQVRAKSTELQVRDAIDRAVHRASRQLGRRLEKRTAKSRAPVYAWDRPMAASLGARSVPDTASASLLPMNGPRRTLTHET